MYRDGYGVKGKSYVEGVKIARISDYHDRDVSYGQFLKGSYPATKTPSFEM